MLSCACKRKPYRTAGEAGVRLRGPFAYPCVRARDHLCVREIIHVCAPPNYYVTYVVREIRSENPICALLRLSLSVSSKKRKQRIDTERRRIYAINTKTNHVSASSLRGNTTASASPHRRCARYHTVMHTVVVLGAHYDPLGVIVP